MKPTQQVAHDLGCKYIYDDWYRINLHADKVKIGDTLIAETLPNDGIIDTSLSPMVKVSKRSMFAFLKHCDLDFKGREVGEIFDEMLEVAKKFIVRLDSMGVYEPIANTVEFNFERGFLDANMAGVRVTLTLKDIVGGCVE